MHSLGTESVGLTSESRVVSILLVESHIGTERRGGREFPLFLDVAGLTPESGGVRPAPLRPE